MKHKLCFSLHLLLAQQNKRVGKIWRRRETHPTLSSISFSTEESIATSVSQNHMRSKIQSCEFSFTNRFWIESLSCEEGSKLCPCSLATRPPLRNDESRRDAGSPCILCPALTRSKCRLQALRWYEVERGIYRVRNPSVRHKTPSCASMAWTKYESLCTPSDGTALIAIDVN